MFVLNFTVLLPLGVIKDDDDDVDDDDDDNAGPFTKFRSSGVADDENTGSRHY